MTDIAQNLLGVNFDYIKYSILLSKVNVVFPVFS